MYLLKLNIAIINIMFYIRFLWKLGDAKITVVILGIIRNFMPEAFR